MTQTHNLQIFVVIPFVVLYLEKRDYPEISRLRVCVIINKRSFELLYVFGSCFGTLAVILVSGFFPFFSKKFSPFFHFLFFSFLVYLFTCCCCCSCSFSCFCFLFFVLLLGFVVVLFDGLPETENGREHGVSHVRPLPHHRQQDILVPAPPPASCARL